MAYFQLASEQDVGDTGLAADAFRQLAGSVHPLALGNVKRTIEQISLLAKKLIRLHTPDADDTTLTEIVTRMTTEPYCHSHMFTRAEATAIGLPVERPSEDLEARLLAYYDQLKADLEKLEKFDPGAILRASRQPPVPVVVERAYIETADTCDAFVTRGVISEQQLTETPADQEAAPPAPTGRDPRCGERALGNHRVMPRAPLGPSRHRTHRQPLTPSVSSRRRPWVAGTPRIGPPARGRTPSR